jgi:glycosyltransferase involved in cell wall biosynthesis
MLSFCVVIPATDSRPTLERCLEAIRRAAEAPEEVVVVDEPRGLGPAAARNEGARRADADVLVFLDSDIEVHADAFRRFRRALEGDPALVAVFGSYDDDPGGEGLVSGFRNLLHHYVHQSGAGSVTTFWAGLGAIRRDEFLGVGGFDEDRFANPSVEDIELGMRLTALGKRVVLDPTVQGKHLKRWTLVSMVRTDLLRRGSPWVELIVERGSDSTVLNLGWRHRISAAASAGLVAAALARKPKLAGTAIGLLLWLNADFYALLYRKRGPSQAAAGVPLHVLHHLVSLAAVPLGVVQHLRRRARATGER